MAAILSSLISVLLFGSSFATIPEAICSISDPELDFCLKDSINKIIPQLSTEGIPEVNLDPLDPFTIKSVHLKTPAGEHFSGELALEDVVVKGLINTEVKTIRSDMNRLQDQNLEVTIGNPKIMIMGKYSGNALVEGMKIFGDGQFKFLFKNIGAAAKIVADSPQGPDGKNYFTIRTLDLTPQIGSLTVNATGLFGKNSALASFVLEQINNYWRPFYDSLYPQVKPLIENLIKVKVNLYTTKVSTDNIVLP